MRVNRTLRMRRPTPKRKDNRNFHTGCLHESLVKNCRHATSVRTGTSVVEATSCDEGYPLVWPFR